MVLLSVLLAFSVALNVYLYGLMTLEDLGIEQQRTTEQKDQSVVPPATKKVVNAPSPIEIAFHEYDFFTVLTLFEKLHQDDQSEALALKHLWFEQIFSTIRGAKSSGGDHPYGEFIKDYLRIYPYDAEFLYLEVIDSDDNSAPLDLLIALFNLAQKDIDRDLQSLLQGQIQDNLKSLINQLSEIGAWDILAVSLETLLPYAPEDRRILINLANAYAQSGQFGLLENTLSYLPQNDPEIARLRQFRDNQLAKLETQAQEITPPGEAIALNRIGDHFLVGATLDDEHQALLMIDTGASTTVISEAFFDRIQRFVETQYLGRYNVNTANGQVRAPVFRFRTMNISGYSVPDIAIIVLPMKDLQADGLLGMNFLRNFRFLIDQEENSLYLFARS